MNEFYKDAQYFAHYISENFEEVLDDNLVIQLTLNWALCVEHYLKGILYDINPIYILVNPDFKNSAKAIYGHKVIVDAIGSKELVDKPDNDVIIITK